MRFLCCRGLEFIREFLLEFLAGTNDLQQAATNAYTRSLKPYHSYVVRGVFAVSFGSQLLPACKRLDQLDFVP